MTNNRICHWYFQIILVVIGAVLGVLLGIGWEAFKDRRNERKREEGEPQVVLQQAEQKRHLLTERDLQSSIEEYERLETLIKSRSLDDTTTRRIRARCYAGISRAYADWATLRNWRGLSRGDYPQRAQNYAL